MVPDTGSNQTAFAQKSTFSVNPGQGIIRWNRGSAGTSTLLISATTAGDANISLSPSSGGTGRIHMVTGFDFNVFTNDANRFTVGSNANVQIFGNLGISSTNPTAIDNLGTNASGNIGSTTRWFNTVFARAFQGNSVTAFYADLAEKYKADAHYECGTVLVFGGSEEVTLANNYMDTKVAGVVSTNPAYVMNQGCDSEFVATVALQGKVPTKVIGPVGKGDMLVTGPNGYAIVSNSPVVGSLVGKSLENFTATEEVPTAIINVVVGKA
jgi:hypothetical protein